MKKTLRSKKKYGFRLRYSLKGQEYPISLTPLFNALHKSGIKATLRVHPAYAQEGEAAEKLIGYCPAGKWQILIEYRGNTYSVIRGMVSFGYYEIMKMKIGGSRKGKKFADDPERFTTPRELIEALIGKRSRK